MKKILFASTALVATAGVAAAEIEFSGNARFGLAYSEGATQDDNLGNEITLENETRIEQRMRFQVKGTAETDGGVSFHARFRAEAGETADNAINGGGFGAAEFGVSFGGLNVYVGRTSNVFDSGDHIDTTGYGVGLTYFLETDKTLKAPKSGFGSSDADKTNVKVDYTVGDFMVSASYSKDQKLGDGTEEKAATADTPATPAVPGVQSDITEIQIGAGYNLNGTQIGLAYSSTDNGTTTEDYTMFGVNGSFGDLAYSVVIGDGDVITDTAVGMSVKYALSSATDLTAVYATGGNDDNDSYGIGVAHSLGGGVSLRGGVASVNDVTKADFGVTFGF